MDLTHVDKGFFRFRAFRCGSILFPCNYQMASLVVSFQFYGVRICHVTWNISLVKIATRLQVMMNHPTRLRLWIKRWPFISSLYSFSLFDLNFTRAFRSKILRLPGDFIVLTLHISGHFNLESLFLFAFSCVLVHHWCCLRSFLKQTVTVFLWETRIFPASSRRRLCVWLTKDPNIDISPEKWILLMCLVRFMRMFQSAHKILRILGARIMKEDLLIHLSVQALIGQENLRRILIRKAQP